MRSCFVALVAVAMVLTPALAAVDQWALAGHGNARALYSGDANEWSITLTPQKGHVCNYTMYNTPFSGYTVAAGANMRDDGMIHIPFSCTKTRSTTQAQIWAVNGNSGLQEAFVAVNKSAWDSPLVYMPDGSLLAGLDQTSVYVFDKETLEVSYDATGLMLGDCGAQVLAVSNSVPQQIHAAGGCGGWDWWGGSCNIVNGHELTKCATDADTTVNMGADGKTMYNNQRFEDPQGVARFQLPFPSEPEAFNNGYVSWPWWIRTDVAGNVFVLDDTASLEMWTPAIKRKWHVATASDAMGVLVTDDEKTVVVTSASALYTYDAATGHAKHNVSYASFGAASCETDVSPWMRPAPIALSDSDHVVLICTTRAGAWFGKLVQLSTGAPVAGTVPFSFAPDQIIVDSAGNIYNIGIRTTPAIEKKVLSKYIKL